MRWSSLLLASSLLLTPGRGVLGAQSDVLDPLNRRAPRPGDSGYRPIPPPSGGQRAIPAPYDQPVNIQHTELKMVVSPSSVRPGMLDAQLVEAIKTSWRQVRGIIGVAGSLRPWGMAQAQSYQSVPVRLSTGESVQCSLKSMSDFSGVSENDAAFTVQQLQQIVAALQLMIMERLNASWPRFWVEIVKDQFLLVAVFQCVISPSRDDQSDGDASSRAAAGDSAATRFRTCAQSGLSHCN
ncbi:MAG: hypothetical protein M1832_003403 [Thelocarpon impressellum]|nr:MAG: hypothetical protein M1832_003403 [Thelocarpon impressellum]